MMLYELASGCTSIVAENEDHSIALARNLDFPGGDFLRQRLYRANWSPPGQRERSAKIKLKIKKTCFEN